MKPLLVAVYDRSETKTDCRVEIGDKGGSILNRNIIRPDVNINQTPDPSPPNTDFWRWAISIGIILQPGEEG